MPGCEIVGVCDREEMMARQLYERYPVKKYFDDVCAFLKAAPSDVVHITTPPQSHYSLGKLCLEAGRSVYIEKPFTVNLEETEELIQLAIHNNLKITAGHNAQFTHAAQRMRKIIREGFLGGPPVHMECYYCYDLGDASYAKAMLGDEKHWVRSLPGKLLQNIISHGISKIVEYLEGDSPKVIARGFTSNFLKSLKESDIIDELRVIIEDNRATTAYFTFSSQLRPNLHQFRIYGSKNSLIIDDDSQTVIQLNGKKYKSYLDQFIPPFVLGKQYLCNSYLNIRKFLMRDFHMNAGMRNLIRDFYNSIANNGPLPIPYQEIILTSKIMDSIFCQISRNLEN
jgi:predicted dehydrogenase